MFSPGSRRVEQKKTVFRHRLFFVLGFREALWGRALSQNRSRGGCAQIRCALVLPSEARRAVGCAAGVVEERKAGETSPVVLRLRMKKGRRVLRLRAGGGVRSAGPGGAAFFRERSVILGAGIGDVPDGGLGSRAVRRAVACSGRTRLFCLWNKCSALFLGRVGKYARVAPGNPAADRQSRKKKKMNKIAWLNAWQNFHH